MDLLRVAVVGPDNTPYHNGLFFFDIRLPPDYPSTPPVSKLVPITSAGADIPCFFKVP